MSPRETVFTALPTLAETPAELTRRARSIIPSARICASTGGHRLGRWTRGQTGRRDSRYYSATCRACTRTAYVLAGHGVNEYGGDAVLLRCAARPENRCQESLPGYDTFTDHTGTVRFGRACPRPYVTIWHSGHAPADGPGLKLCSEHTRAYRIIAAGHNPHGWRQTGGPADA